MQRHNSFDRKNVFTDREKLPVGGYVLKIMDAEDKFYSADVEVLLISFDIAEGEFKDFYANSYRAQVGEDKKWKGTYRLYVPKEDGSDKDAITIKRFNTTIAAIEDSNPGYHWDWNEKTLKGKLIGALFNNREYEIDGRKGFYTNCHSFVTVDKIRTGKFTIPADSLLKNHTASSSSADMGFMNIPDDAGDGLPFD